MNDGPSMFASYVIRSEKKGEEKNGKGCLARMRDRKSFLKTKCFKKVKECSKALNFQEEGQVGLLLIVLKIKDV